jgi:HK97 family phage prohead protease
MADEDDRAEKRPYPGEHAARINDPDKYDSFRRVNDEGGEGVDFVYGILPDGGVEIESIRFDADEFTVEQARQWLEDNDFTAIKFEPATGSSERSETVLHSVQIMGTDMANREVRSRIEGAEIRSEDGEIRVSGYAAVFGEETNIGGMFTESIARGAFKKAIDRQDDVVFLINHDGLPLARTRSGTLKLSEDERGLFMEASLDMEDPDVRSIVPKMKRGDLDKMSFAFIPDRQEWDDSGDMPRRTIQDLRLYDVSIVTTPAYDGTEIGLRSLEAYRQAQKKSQAPRRLRMKAKLKG